MRRISLLLTLVAVIAASCATEPATTTTTRAEFDPAELFAEPDLDLRWTRLIRGVTVLGATADPVAEEIELLSAAIADIPQPLLDAIPLRYFIRSDESPGDVHEATVAFAKGRDIFLTASTFEGMTRATLTRILIHELTHVAQFADLDETYLDSAAAAGLTLIDVAAASNLVRDYAAAVGWTDRSGGALAPQWELSPDGAAGTTTYGTSAPEEDQAEAVSFVATGRGPMLSSDRVRWVEQWLGLAADQLSMGMPWVPAGAVATEPDIDLYDPEATRRLVVRNVEPAYWLLPADSAPAPSLAEEVGSRLRQRGYAGRLEEVAEKGADRFAGRFVRNDGFILWVELWDFRGRDAARTAAGPILSYVAAW